MQIENGIPAVQQDRGRRPNRTPYRWLAIAALMTPIAISGCSSSSTKSGAASTSTSALVGVNTTLSPLSVTTLAADVAPTVPSLTEPATTTTVEPTTTTEAPTTTTLPFVTQGAVVLVANATNLSGGGTKLTLQLKKAGFTMQDATNAAGMDEFLDVSKIYVLPGGEAVADTLSRVMGGIAVLKMPIPAPINDANLGLKDATVLIMLGRDHVGKKPPNLPPT